MSENEALYRLQKLRFKRTLRRLMTPAERVLWEALRNRKLLGLKWRRQANIGHFVADFLCAEHLLIVEVDGGIHESQEDYDRLRTEVINRHGYRVIRFRNEEVLFGLTAVLERIGLETIKG
ncbi:MAG: endonuclease domain-containing protein [Candidatus Peribacteraceae bacterium]|nr:endonuclease domain-containing protein [Candidatus Peribacteraceae bacterium]